MTKPKQAIDYPEFSASRQDYQVLLSVNQAVALKSILLQVYRGYLKDVNKTTITIDKGFGNAMPNLIDQLTDIIDYMVKQRRQRGKTTERINDVQRLGSGDTIDSDNDSKGRVEC